MKEAEKEAKRIIEMFDFSNYDIAKQCALLHVNGFLEFHEKLYITEGSLVYQYWQQVKQAIENK